jgi:3-phenylpropionate/cinnamic acid dioxygenase small subunit
MGDEQLIANVIYRYAELVDNGDFDAVGALFDHATYRSVVPGGISSSTGSEVADVMRSMVRTYADGTPRTSHITTNLAIEVDGDRATSKCRFTVFQNAPGQPMQPIINGRYHDAFEKVDGAWRFTDRLIKMELFGDLSHHLTMDPMA